ncbi:Hpt domain-containing protein [Arthrobacter sp. M4]|uniref:Hpt domain-containing protein n=1 Tax=Arthrobacter sp. M4 TaxID=218160 RepID=UPI001CDCC2BD|nr:Hpt domain-containing protein [Arthrobacter sp. M4]MCA4133935.1 Hpt domain-containing protein [Arthrobacter sp. M4]
MHQLPVRINRLHSALCSADSHAAMDAVLSLKTSSRMVGAVCLGSLASELETQLRTIPESEHSTELPRLCEHDQLWDLIDQCSHETVEQFMQEPAA